MHLTAMRPKHDFCACDNSAQKKNEKKNRKSEKKRRRKTNKSHDDSHALSFIMPKWKKKSVAV